VRPTNDAWPDLLLPRAADNRSRYAWSTMSDPKHPDGDIHKGAVEDETPHSHTDNPYLHGQLGHRTSNVEIKENDTDFPGPDAMEEHSGEKGS
jgi:hypothetical protein